MKYFKEIKYLRVFKKGDRKTAPSQGQKVEEYLEPKQAWSFFVNILNGLLFLQRIAFSCYLFWKCSFSEVVSVLKKY